MKNYIKIGMMIFASCTIGALGAWFLLGGSSDEKEAASVQEKRLSKTKRSGSVKKVTEISVSRKSGKRSVRIVESEKERPNVLEAAEIDDEDKLTEVQRSVLSEIQEALDSDDLKALRKALSRFTAKVSNGGLGSYENVPRVIRSAAVQALGWFGKDAAVDLIDFMADADEEVSSDAFDQFELALQDVDMSDFDRAEIVKTTAKALTDSDRIDTLISSLNDMRNSVRGDTAISILMNGSEQTKAHLCEELSFYFDDEVKTVDDINKWMAENPDDTDDDELYGGSTSAD